MRSISQANVYINLLSQPTNCSDNIYFLVCLYYFPTCTVRKDGAVPAYPYLHVCEEVNLRCSERLIKAPGKQFTDCSSTYYDGKYMVAQNCRCSCRNQLIVGGAHSLQQQIPLQRQQPSQPVQLQQLNHVQTTTILNYLKVGTKLIALVVCLCIVTSSLNSGFSSSFLYGAGIGDATIRCRTRRSKFSDILSKNPTKKIQNN